MLRSDLNNSVLTLTIDRPPVNALDHETIYELQKALAKAARDPGVRCVALTGAGRSFCAGHDVTEMLAARGEEISYREHLLKTYNPLILQIRQIEKPVLAAVNGPVAGAGLGVALACDLRLAADTARFTVGFAGIGLAPDSGVSLFLPALIGLGRATEFAFSNAPIPAQQALEWGLVNQVVQLEDLRAHMNMVAGMLAKGPTGAFGLAKRAFNRSVYPNLEDALDYEGHLQEIASQGGEHKEGVRAFLEKRLPEFGKVKIIPESHLV
ncbi:MAG: enoyl-CoA hydratase-related protein [Chloroflexota bacterium]